MRLSNILTLDACGGSAAGFLPMMAGGGSCLLWLRADQGVTLSNASVNALSAWTLSNCTRTLGIADPFGGTAAIQLTDTVDGGPVAHSATGTTSNAVVGPSMFDIWVKSPTSDWVAFLPSPSTFAYYRYSTKTVGGKSASVTLQYLQTLNGWDQLRITESTGTTGVAAQVIMATGDGGNPYQGDGTRTVQVYGPVTTQNRVSAWADQSGNGNNGTQGTAGSQKLLRCYDSAGNWIPSPGINCDIGWPIDGLKSVVLAAGIKTAFTGNGVPMTYLVLKSILGVTAGNNVSGLHLTTPANGTQILDNYNTPPRLVVLHTDDGSVSKSQTASSNYSTSGYKSLAFTYDGAFGNIFQDGVSVGGPTDLDVGTETPSSALIYTQFSVVREVAIYNTVLSTSDKRLAENGMRARWGLPLL